MGTESKEMNPSAAAFEGLYDLAQNKGLDYVNKAGEISLSRGRDGEPVNVKVDMNGKISIDGGEPMPVEEALNKLNLHFYESAPTIMGDQAA